MEITRERLQASRLAEEARLQELQREFRDLLAQAQAIADRMAQNRSAFERAVGAIEALDALLRRNNPTSSDA